LIEPDAYLSLIGGVAFKQHVVILNPDKIIFPCMFFEFF